MSALRKLLLPVLALFLCGIAMTACDDGGKDKEKEQQKQEEEETP